ncbi:hypothetical protein GQ607_013725 [Colletotrichum asianum]|uniref:Uncharacterized protein n=1 Tax=Colletotrichum asianum TaxID=702518 RepID=A0A8H3ZGP2_9PEZI|nr:hypothetical protein GQ607_013725 [Colletotrichum asianum]
MIIAMTSYAIHVHEDRNDLETLLAQKHRLKVAMSVQAITGAHPSNFNVVYQSVPLSPNMHLCWTGQYAINWISHIPADGTRLENFNGNWQPWRIGKSYSLHRTGYWDKASPTRGLRIHNTIEVSGNDYGSVHVVVGLQRSEPSGKTTWVPIFIDESELAKGGGRRYELDHRVKMWFGTEDSDSTKVSRAELASTSPSVTEALVMRSEVWTRYNTLRRKWETANP